MLLSGWVCDTAFFEGRKQDRRANVRLMTDGLEFDRPRTHQMRFNGVYGEKWSGWFDGLTITPQDNETPLTGPICDQVALHGLLAWIRDQGLPLPSVKGVGDKHS